MSSETAKKRKRDGGGDEQRPDDDTEQRTAFVEDMARIRTAMEEEGSGEAGADTSSGAPSGDVGGSEAVNERADENARDRDDGTEKEGTTADSREGNALPSQQQGGESTLQQQQPSGESTLQQQRHVESEDEEEGGGNRWLQNFAPHHTRVGDNYQVTELPPAPPAAVAAAPTGSCVSPGGSGA